MIISPRETMLYVLAHLRQRYGGIGGYVEQVGISAEQVESLRASLLE